MPSDQVGVVAKYVGGEAPRLHRLGGTDWVRGEDARSGAPSATWPASSSGCTRVRMSVPGHAFGPDTPWQRELEDAFPHEETRDQLAAIDEVKRDMESAKPMDRLICGDVGYGKTEVAVRAAFKAVMDGKQVAVLVPTTLLAEQHFVTFSERFAPFPVKVAMLSRFLSRRRAEARSLDERAKGEVDVVIGTHRLLSRRRHVQGPRAAGRRRGAAVRRRAQGAAEEAARERGRADDDGDADPAHARDGARRHPRHVERRHAAGGPPAGADLRRAPTRRSMALGAVRRELLRGGQVFWVHNRVADDRARGGRAAASSCPTRASWSAHGQMDEEQLEKVMMAFWDRTADVLVCTTIIESGLDVPSANTLVVERADRLGLAQMYQLRGRVGRSAERAFAYLFFPPQARADRGGARAPGGDQPVSRRSGRGFQIAMKDLEIRGAGNLLGRRAARPHRRGRVRHVRAAAGRVGRRDEGRAGPGGAGGPRSTCR